MIYYVKNLNDSDRITTKAKQMKYRSERLMTEGKREIGGYYSLPCGKPLPKLQIEFNVGIGHGV